jgi:hypothetical protein
MFHLRKSTTQTITRDLATQMATMPSSPTERTFSERRLAYLQGVYADGLFLPCQWASVWLGGSQLRMNGQHSSTMLMKLPDPFPTGLTAHLDEYEAEAPEDMVALFRQFDARPSARTASDIAGAYQFTYPELHDIPRESAKRGIEGIAWYLRVIEGIPTGSGDDRYQLFRQPVHYDFLHWLGQLLDIKTPEFKRMEVIAAMYATDVANQPVARAFWEEVARGGRPYEDTHPTTVLDKWLKACKDGTCEDTMKASYHYQGCIYAWNAFREGKIIKEVRFNTSKGLYTPHD